MLATYSLIFLKISSKKIHKSIINDFSINLFLNFQKQMGSNSLIKKDQKESAKEEDQREPAKEEEKRELRNEKKGEDKLPKKSKVKENKNIEGST